MNLTKNLFISILFALATCTVFAQDGILKGNVTDAETKEPMFSVNVFEKGTTHGTTSDFDGNYELSLGSGTHTIVFKFLGYAEQEIQVDITAGKTNKQDIVLEKQAQQVGLVTVTGGKYEKDVSEEVVSMEVLKLNTIQNSNSRMEESLNKIPGINMVGENISIRGGAGFSAGANTRVMMLLDDVPLVGFDNGTIRWESLPLESIEQIEVIKGASSALYGMSAMNGVINVRTANPGPEPYTKLVANLGVYEQPTNKAYSYWWKEDHHTPMFGGLSIVHRRRFKNIDLCLNSNYRNDQSYLQGNDKNSFRLGGKLRHISQKIRGLSTGVNVNYFYEGGHTFFVWAGLDSSIYIPKELTPFINRTISVDPYVTYFDKKQNKHSIKARIYNVKYNNFGPEFSNVMQYLLDYSFVREFSKVGVTLTTGLTGNYSRINSKTLGDRKLGGGNAGWYLQADKKFFKRLTVSVGTRLEYFQADSIVGKKEIKLFSLISKDSVVSPVVPVIRAGLNFQASRGTFIRASFGQGYRFPTPTELFVSTRRNGFPVFGNPDLRPESGWSAELGIKQAVKLKEWFAYFDLAGFWTEYKDMMEYAFVFNPPIVGAQTKNVESARISGAELSAVGQGKIVGVPFNFLLGYTFMYPVNIDSLKNGATGDNVILKYRNLHSAKADVEAAYKGINLGFSFVYNSYILNYDYQAEGLAPGITAYRANEKHNGSFVFDIRLGYEFTNKAKVSFLAKNLLNDEYYLRPGLLEAPRNYAVQLSYEF